MLRSAESGSSTTWRAIVVVPMVGARLVELDRARRRPTTVIASPTPATFISTLSVTSLAATSRTSRFSTVWKPLSSALTDRIRAGLEGGHAEEALRVGHGARG